MYSGCLAVLLLSFTNSASAWIDYPPTGLATLTHYDLPKDYIAACGCTPSSTHYPTAALSQLAYGSSNAYGPACGRCFKLTLINPVIASPPFYPSETKSLVVKVTDLCPFSEGGWCGAQENQPNSAGAYLNFDLAYPSEAIPKDWFPSNEALYGYKDFGVWNISYEVVSCFSGWPGAKNAAALGSVANLGTSVCCPDNPTGDPNNTCPSYSDENRLPPITTTNSSMDRVHFISSRRNLLLILIPYSIIWILILY